MHTNHHLRQNPVAKLLALLLCVAFLLAQTGIWPPQEAHAAVALNSATTGIFSTIAANVSYNAGTGTDRVLVVVVASDDATNKVTSLKYANVSMTQAAYVPAPATAAIQLFYLVNPAAGANTLAFTTTAADRYAYVVAYAIGADTSGVGAIGTPTTGNSSAVSVTISPQASGSLLIGAFADDSAATSFFTPVSGTTEAGEASNSIQAGMFYKTSTGTGVHTLGATAPTADDWAGTALEIKGPSAPVATCSSSPSNITFYDLGSNQCRGYISTAGASTFIVPSNWTTSNSIEVIGGGGGGRNTSGGGGGAYTKIVNVSNTYLTAGETVNVMVGAGGTGSITTPTAGADTYVCQSTTGCTSYSDTGVIAGAKGGGAGGTSAGGVGGASASAIVVGTGSVVYSGGAGGGASASTGSGGGGAGGPSSNGFAGTLTGVGGNGGTGSGSTGGTSGGTTGGGGPGGAGTQWGSYGSGAGGGAGDTGGGVGGLYGGGGGGAAEAPGNSGARGIIVITYSSTPPVPTVTLSSSGSPSESPLTTGTYTLARDLTTAALTVSYAMTGGATYGSSFDYTLGAGTCTSVSATSATMPAGSASCTIVLTPNNDTAAEAAETAVLTVNANATYTGTPQATLTITSEDYTISSTQNTATISLWDADLAPPGTIGSGGTGGFSIAPVRVRSGTTAMFTWTVADMLTCTINNGVGAVDATTGTHTQATPAITSNKTFTLTCSDGTNPSVSRSASVGIIPSYIEI